MTFYLLDAALQNHLGHHFQSCQQITRELRRRNIDVEIHGSAACTIDEIEGVKVHKTFRCSPYWHTTGDLAVGWWMAFEKSVAATYQDLADLGVSENDIVYVNSAQAPQLYAVSTWLREEFLDPPKATLEFGVDPGLSIELVGSSVQAAIPDPRVDARPMLYRYAANMAKEFGWPKNLTLCTFDQVSSQTYSALLETEVKTLPVPRSGKAEYRGSLQRHFNYNTPMLGLVGHWRGERGFHMVPEICYALLNELPNLSIYFHNGDAANGGIYQQQMRDMAKESKRVAIDERCADDKVWQEILDKIDLCLCPYQPERFAVSYSAVCAECCANGIPMVVPVNTSLARMAGDFGAGVGFQSWDVSSIVEATAKAVGMFKELAEKAFENAAKWETVNGPKRLADVLLERLVDMGTRADNAKLNPAGPLGLT